MSRGLYHDFASVAFPGLSLRVPLIAQWPDGLRLSLGGPFGWSQWNRSAIHEVRLRATTLFEAIFEPYQDGFLAAQYEFVQIASADQKRPFIGGESDSDIAAELWDRLSDEFELTPYLEGVAPDHVGFVRDQPDPDGASSDLDPDAGAFTVVFPVAPRQIDYRGLLVATINREVALHPSIQAQLFFAHPIKSLIVNVPDDRWLDVVGDPAALRGVLTKFPSYLESGHIGDPGRPR